MTSCQLDKHHYLSVILRYKFNAELIFSSVVITELQQETPQRDVNSHDSGSDIATTVEDVTCLKHLQDVTAKTQTSDVTAADRDDK